MAYITRALRASEVLPWVTRTVLPRPAPGSLNILERLLTHFWMSRDIFSSSDLRVSGGVFIHSSITDGGIR